jgi:hypothetical protein
MELHDLGYAAGMAAPGDRLPGAALVTDLGRTYTNDNATTPETSLLAGGAALTSVFPVARNVGDSYDIFLAGTFLNTSGSNKTQRIRIYHGGFAFFDETSASAASSATARQWWVRMTVMVATLGAGTVATLRTHGLASGTGAGFVAGTGWQDMGAGQIQANEGASTGTDANLSVAVPRDFNVTATHSAAGTNLSSTLNLAIVRHYPKLP